MLGEPPFRLFFFKYNKLMLNALFVIQMWNNKGNGPHNRSFKLKVTQKLLD